MSEPGFSTSLTAAVRNLSGTRRGCKQLVSVSVDAWLVLFSLWGAYSLRLGQPLTDIGSHWHLFLLLPPVTVLIFGSFGVYRWVVRSSNSRLYHQLVKGTLVASTLLLIGTVLLPPEAINPRSVFIIFGLLLAGTTCGARMAWVRIIAEKSGDIPIAVYGAGSAGRQLVFILSKDSEYNPVCFIDDAIDYSSKSLVTSLGLPVIPGGASNLEQRLTELKVSQIVVAIPAIQSADYLVIVDRLERLSIPFKTLPTLGELMSGVAGYGEFREISITDILERSEVPPDPFYVKQCIRGKSVLVTGGGGSIGSELCRQIVRLQPRKLTILDNNEANLYHITEDIEAAISGLDFELVFEPVLCSVTDKARVQYLFDNNDFDTVYHAAAYKHVPIVEAHPQQGVEVNVFGTLNVVQAAIDNKVRNFLLISSDKAVRPTSVMGCTKRVAELILQAKSMLEHSTIISMVRFGNVLASTGSVVPKFQKQIDAGGPVTLTHSDITRYFMTIPEASQLVLQASSIAKGGDVFVLEMGESIKISRLAETMIRLHRRQIEQKGGRAPEIAVKIVGLRPGEKMYEELFIDHTCMETVVPKVLTAEERYLHWDELEPLLLQLDKSVEVATTNMVVKEKLQNIVFNSAQHTPSAINPEDAAQGVSKRARLSSVN